MYFKIAGNGMKYTFDTGNALLFPFDKWDIYDIRCAPRGREGDEYSPAITFD